MKPDWKRVIAHVDMDAFFAAVEVLNRPELAGKPLIIGADPRKGKGRGVVSTASYEARKFGVHSAMPITRAWQLCPQGIYIKPHFQRYKACSDQVFQILGTFSPQIQIVSVDEAFLDLTGSLHLYGGDVPAMGREVKERIRQETGLTASMGIAPSKSVAKIASDFNKPDGLTIVPEAQVQSFLDPLPLIRIWGVGKKTLASLEKRNLHTVKDLRAYPEQLLEDIYGKMGGHLYRMARGIDQREVHEGDAIKSVSHETTFGSDQTDPELIASTLLGLSEKVAIRLRKHHFKGKTVQLKLRFEDFSTFTRSHTAGQGLHRTSDIYSVGLSLLQQFKGKMKPVRLIGIGVSQLVDERAGQLNFLEDDNRKDELEKVMDSLQRRFGRRALTHADTLRNNRESTTDAGTENE